MIPLSRQLAVLVGVTVIAASYALRQSRAQAVGQSPGGVASSSIFQRGVVTMGVSPASQSGPSELAPINDPASMVTLEGHVVNALTGQPLRQANLTIMVLQSPAAAAAGSGPVRMGTQNVATTSDTAGNFKFENLPPGSYILAGDKSGYVRQQYNAGTGTGPQGGGPLIIALPGETIRDVEIKLMPQGILSGTVVDENGEPVANASIQVLKFTTYFHRTQSAGGGSSNAVGEFLIGGLLPGKYLIRAENRSGIFGNAPEPATTGRGAHESYVPTLYPSSTTIDSAATVPVGAGQRVDALEIRLQRDHVFSVSGRVLGMEPESADAPRVQVSLRPQTQDALAPRPLSPAIVMSDGRFEIHSVPPGSYYLTAIRLRQGGPSPTATIPISVNNDVENLTISTNDTQRTQTSGTVRIEGEEAGRVSMTVILQAASALPFGGPPPSPGRVQSDGSFQIDNVPPGKYTVNVGGIPRGSFVKQIHAGAADILMSGLDLTESQSVAPLDIVIGRNAAALSGTVHEADQLKPRAYITLFPEPMRPEARQWMRSAVTDANGFFQLSGVAPGTYRLYAWAEPVQTTSLQPDDLTPYEGESLTVSLDEGDSKQVDLQLIEPQ